MIKLKFGIEMLGSIVLLLCGLSLLYIMFYIASDYFYTIDTELFAEDLLIIIMGFSVFAVLLLACAGVLAYMSIDNANENIPIIIFKAVIVVLILILIIIIISVFYSPMLNGEFREIQQQLVDTLEITECEQKLQLIDTYKNMLIGDYEYSNQFLVIDDRKLFTQSEWKKLHDSYIFTCLTESKINNNLLQESDHQQKINELTDIITEQQNEIDDLKN